MTDIEGLAAEVTEAASDFQAAFEHRKDRERDASMARQTETDARNRLDAAKNALGKALDELGGGQR